MRQFIRTSLFPLVLVIIVTGFIIGKPLLFGIIGGVLLIFVLFFYSSRKSRMRYWIQGYKTHLEQKENNKQNSISAIQREFCEGKYANKHICGSEYQDIDTLIEDIIKEEFNLARLILSQTSSPSELQENILAYEKEKKKVKKEVQEVKKEVLS